MSWAASNVANLQKSDESHWNNIITDVRAGKVWDTSATPTKWIRHYHNGTVGVIDTSSGDIRIVPNGGNTRFYNSASTVWFSITAASAAISLVSNDGRFDLRPWDGVVRIADYAGTTYLNVGITSAAMSMIGSAGRIDLRPFNGNTRICDYAGTTYLNVGITSAATTLTSSLGRIDLKPLDGITRIYDTAGTTYLETIVGANTAIKPSTGGLILRAGATESISLTNSTGAYGLMITPSASSNLIVGTGGFIAIRPQTHILECGTSGTRSYIKLFDSGKGAFRYLYIHNSAAVISAP